MANLFLTGHRKSGTSMLSRLFDSHPELTAYPADISLLYAYFPAFTECETEPKKLRQRIDLVLRKSLGNSLSSSREDEDINVCVSDFVENMLTLIPDDGLCDKKVVLQALVAAWREASGAEESTGIVLKETSQSVHFFEIKDALPNLKFLHLLRDPRDVYAAIKAGVAKHYGVLGEGERESLASVLNRYKIDSDASEVVSELYPDDFSTIRFEDLVSYPERTMRYVADFGGFSFDRSLLFPTTIGTAYQGNNHDGVVMSGISSQNVGRWRERIKDEEAMVIEFWLGTEMERHGYQRQFSKADTIAAFSKFYHWYNTKYFYSDSFAQKPEV